MPRLPKPTVAFCYDFDGTLAPGNMQEHTFIPDIGLSSSDFWNKTKAWAKSQGADEILAYMHVMLQEANRRNVSIRKSDFQERGRQLAFYEGVQDWFDRISDHGRALGINVEHFVLSSGIREMIEACAIGPKLRRVYASSFMYDANNVAIWPALAVNYTTKTQYLFRINKGTLDPWDNSEINKYKLDSDRAVPFSQIVFIGDGETDIPCMRLVSEKGGYAIAVYAPRKKAAREKVDGLIGEGRVRFTAPADYREGKKLDQIAKAILSEILAKNYLARIGGKQIIRG
jgi:phosphoserine phosphatase